MTERRLGRREFLKLMAGAAAGSALAACKPQIVKETVVVEKPVEKVVKETVVVEKPVEKVVKETVVVTEEKVVKETVEKVVTATPLPRTGITFWGMPMPRYAEEIAKYIPGFEEEHPTIKVNYEPWPDEGSTKFLTMAVAGNAPDVTNNGSDQVWAWARNGLLMDLKSFYDEVPRAYLVDWSPRFLQWLTARDGSGAIWGVPMRQLHMVLLYNKTAFDEVGVDYPLEWDHDVYLTEGAKFRKEEGGKVVRWAGHAIVKATLWLEQKLKAFGGNLVDPEDWTRCALGDDESQEALEWLYKAIWEDNIWPQTAQIESYWYAPFDSGGIVTQECASWIIGIWYEAIQDRFQWDFAPYPKGPTGVRAACAGSDCYTMWAETSHPDEAWEWMKFLISDDGETVMMTAAGSEPARRSMYPEWYRIVREQFPLMAEDTNWAAFEQPMKEGFDYVTGVFADPNIASEILAPALELFIDAGEVMPDHFKGIGDEITEALRAEYG
jgi:multiple sugar transport system substrate-binding protein